MTPGIPIQVNRWDNAGEHKSLQQKRPSKEAIRHYNGTRKEHDEYNQFESA